MTDKLREPEILNPRYEGAAPENVDSAFLRHRPEDNDDPGPKPTELQSSIPFFAAHPFGWRAARFLSLASEPSRTLPVSVRPTHPRSNLMYSRSLPCAMLVALLALFIMPTSAHAYCMNVYLYETAGGRMDVISGHIHANCREASRYAATEAGKPGSWCDGKKNCRLLRSFPKGDMKVYIAIDSEEHVYAIGTGSWDDDAKNRAEANCRGKGGVICTSTKVW